MKPIKSKEAVPADTGLASNKSTETTLSPQSAAVKSAALVYPPTVPGVKDKKLVEIVNDAGFKRFGKSLMSECRKPELCGVCLQPAAVEAIFKVYPEARPDAPESRRKRKGDGHRYSRRAGCRLSEEVLTQLNAYIQIDGTYQYVSELVHALLMGWLADRKRHYRRVI